MNRHRPPQPPDGVYPVGNRLLGPIPSVPELQSYRDRCLAYTFLRGLEDGISDGWYSVMRDLQRSEQALDDARWRLACASWRWQRNSAELRGGHSDEYWWFVTTGVARLRWLRRNNELADYLPVGKELALRPKTEVVT